MIKSKTGEKVPITSEGSLGLLALGDVGLLLWRETILEERSKIEKISIKNKEMS